GMLPRVAREALDAAPDHLERLGERALRLGISKRREASREVFGDEEREPQRRNERDEEEEGEEPPPKRAEEGEGARGGLPGRAFQSARELAAGRADFDALAIPHGDGRDAGPQIVHEALNPLGAGALEFSGADRIVGNQIDPTGKLPDEPDETGSVPEA